jgi:hypothetical protein
MVIPRWIFFFTMTEVSDKLVEKTKIYILRSIKFLFPENRAVYATLWKHFVQPATAKMVTRTRPNLQIYVHCLSCAVTNSYYPVKSCRTHRISAQFKRVKDCPCTNDHLLLKSWHTGVTSLILRVSIAVQSSVVFKVSVIHVRSRSNPSVRLKKEHDLANWNTSRNKRTRAHSNLHCRHLIPLLRFRIYDLPLVRANFT